MSAANLQQSMVSKKRIKKCFEDERKMKQSQAYYYFSFHKFYRQKKLAGIYMMRNFMTSIVFNVGFKILK